MRAVLIVALCVSGSLAIPQFNLNTVTRTKSTTVTVSSNPTVQCWSTANALGKCSSTTRRQRSMLNEELYKPDALLSPSKTIAKNQDLVSITDDDDDDDSWTERMGRNFLGLIQVRKTTTLSDTLTIIPASATTVTSTLDLGTGAVPDSFAAAGINECTEAAATVTSSARLSGQTYSSDLADPNSDAFKALANTIESGVDANVADSSTKVLCFTPTTRRKRQSQGVEVTFSTTATVTTVTGESLLATLTAVFTTNSGSALGFTIVTGTFSAVIITEDTTTTTVAPTTTAAPTTSGTTTGGTGATSG